MKHLQRKAQILCVVIAAALATASGLPNVWGQKVVVSDLYGEPDVRAEAGALSLLLRSRLYVGKRPAVSRKALVAGLNRIYGVRRPALVVDPTRPDILVALGADRLLSGQVRRWGTGLLAIVHAYNDTGALLGTVVVRVSYGQLQKMAGMLATQLAELVDADVFDHGDASLGQLRPFVLASQLLLQGKPAEAARALASANRVVGSSIPAARDVLDAVISHPDLGLEDRLTAAMAGADARNVLRLVDQKLAKDPTNEIALAIRARARMSQLKFDQAEEDIKSIVNGKSRVFRLARAQLADHQGNLEERDRWLGPLVEELYVPALSWIATLDAKSLGSDETSVLAAAEMILDLPALAAVLGLRAAEGEVETERALALVSVLELSEKEIERLIPIVNKAVTNSWSVGLRLRAELQLRTGNIDGAIGSLRKSLEVEPDGVETRLLLGHLLMGLKKYAEAYDVFEPNKDLSSAVRRAYARAVSLTGDTAGAAEIFSTMSDEGSNVGSSVETQVARAGELVEEDKPGSAVRGLEGLALYTPDNLVMLRALVDANRAWQHVGPANDYGKRADVLEASIRAVDSELLPVTEQVQVEPARQPVEPDVEDEDVAESGPAIGVIIGTIIVLVGGIGFALWRRRKPRPTGTGFETWKDARSASQMGIERLSAGGDDPQRDPSAVGMPVLPQDAPGSQLGIPRLPAPGSQLGIPRLQGPSVVGGVGGAAEAVDALVGLERYRRGDQIGHSPVSADFRATDRTNGKQLTLRLFADFIGKKPMAIKTLFTELSSVAKLIHAGIPEYKDRGQDGGTAYLVVELDESPTLEARLQGRPLLVPQAIDYADQVAAILESAHKHKVYHRILHPRYVRASDDGRITLDGFALGIMIERYTDGGADPRYIAPEQIAGGTIDAQTDIYGLGCMMFEMVTGRPPFIDGDVRQHHLQTEPLRPSMYSAALQQDVDQLILRCLRKNKVERTTSMKEIRDALKKYL